MIAFSLLVAAMAALVILFDRQTRDDAAVQHTLIVQTHLGVLDQDVNFISKPFTIEQLAAKARSVLDGTKC